MATRKLLVTAVDMLVDSPKLNRICVEFSREIKPLELIGIHAVIAEAIREKAN